MPCIFSLWGGKNEKGRVQATHPGLHRKGSFPPFWMQTRTREINGLLEAMKALKIDRAQILTADTQEKIEADGKTIQVTPLWKWLLSG